MFRAPPPWRRTPSSLMRREDPARRVGMGASGGGRIATSGRTILHGGVGMFDTDTIVEDNQATEETAEETDEDTQFLPTSFVRLRRKSVGSVRSRNELETVLSGDRYELSTGTRSTTRSNNETGSGSFSPPVNLYVVLRAQMNN